MIRMDHSLTLSLCYHRLPKALRYILQEMTNIFCNAL